MEAEAILFGGKTGRHASPTMKAYSLNTTICRRKFLYQEFLSTKTMILKISLDASDVIFVPISTCSKCSYYIILIVKPLHLFFI